MIYEYKIGGVGDRYYDRVTVNGKEFLIRRMIRSERDKFLPWANRRHRRTVMPAIATRVIEGDPDWTDDWDDLFVEISGLRSDQSEQSDIDNLYRGVLLALRHPEVAGRDCTLCREWWYGPNGKPLTDSQGRKRKRVGVVPCETQIGCPKGHYDNPIDLSWKNQNAYTHYLECRAVCSFPDDPVVRRNARIIRQAEEAAFWEKLDERLAKIG